MWEHERIVLDEFEMMCHLRIPVIPIIHSGFIRSPDLTNAPRPMVSL